MRLTFVVASLACGGIERAVVSLTSALRREGHDICVVTLAGPGGDFFRLDAGVERFSLDIARDRPAAWWQLPRSAWRRLQQVRAAIDRTCPDVVVAHAPQINVPTLIATLGRSYPVVVTEHGDVPVARSADRPWLRRKAWWYRLRFAAYRRAARVVSVSTAVDRNVSWLAADRRRVIRNPVNRAEEGTAAVPEMACGGRPWLISVGRLSWAKGQDLLLDAFERIAPRFPEWQLLVVGAGELRESLEVRARRLRDQVVFTGAVDPFPLLQRAQLFVMASRYEGFPLAPAEALSCGVPVIAMDCPSSPRHAQGGIRELIGSGGGILVPANDVAALADTMAACMADANLRARLAQQAARAVAPLQPEQIAAHWQALFDELVDGTAIRRRAPA